MSADADIETSLDLLGKSVTDLQEDIVVGDDSIAGTLHLVTGYTGFSGDTEEQSGNYLALHFSCENATSVTVELSDGPRGEVELDSDGIAIFRITDPSQTITVTASDDDGNEKTIVYALDELTYEDE